MAGCTDLELLVDYYWNVALGEALHSSLHATELALRNSVHNRFSHRFETSEWYDIEGVLQDDDLIAIADVRNRATRSKQAPPTADQMVSMLHFGFWTHMVTSPYDEPVWKLDQYAMVDFVFPYATNDKGKRLGRNVLGRHYNKVRMLRNRVIHFEQIFGSNRLIGDHTAIQEGIGWIDPVLRSITESHDTFPDVYHNGKQLISNCLQAFMGEGID